MKLGTVAYLSDIRDIRGYRKKEAVNSKSKTGEDLPVTITFPNRKSIQIQLIDLSFMLSHLVDSKDKRDQEIYELFQQEELWG